MNRERLLRLATFLDALPAERFDFSNWVGKNWGGMPDLSCGTTACAVGWAATLPDMGLTLDPKNNWGGITMNKGQDPLRAACTAFDLSDDDAEKLFVSCWGREGRLPLDASAQEVAAHIRKFVNERSE